MNVIEKMKERIELLEELAETGEEFEISISKNFKFKYIDGEFIAIDKRDIIESGASELVFHLDSKIIREPWTPKVGELYFYPPVTGIFDYGKCKWEHDEVDIYRFNRGFVFKTEEEAIFRKKEILRLIKNNG